MHLFLIRIKMAICFLVKGNNVVIFAVFNYSVIQFLFCFLQWILSNLSLIHSNQLLPGSMIPLQITLVLVLIHKEFFKEHCQSKLNQHFNFKVFRIFFLILDLFI